MGKNNSQREPQNGKMVITRVVAFSILFMLAILVPMYKMFRLNCYFWAAVVVCGLFIWWAYIVFKKLYSMVECPRCHFKMTFQNLKRAGRCTKCGNDLKSLIS